MINKARIEDAEALAGLAIQMWTDHDLEDLTEAFRRLATNDEAVCFIKYVDGKPIGFSQCQLRHDYVEGTESSPVGYLEGIFVSDGYRTRGYASELLSECEKWAKEKGCTEFASDCELDNANSLYDNTRRPRVERGFLSKTRLYGVLHTRRLPERVQQVQNAEAALSEWRINRIITVDMLRGDC